MVLRANNQFDYFDPDAGTYADPSLDTGNMDRSDPRTFSKSIGGFISEVMSPGNIRREAAARSDKISITYQTLRGIDSQAMDEKDPPAETKDTAKCLAEYAGNASPGLPSFRRP